MACSLRSYDSADRLTSVSDGVGVTQLSTYDGLGRRVVRTAGGITRHYHYDQDDRLIATSDASGANWVEWLWLDGQLVAQIEGGAIHAIHSDHLGQPLKMTNASQAIVWQRQARPFGATHAETGTPANPIRFPGQLTDPATATHYNMARDYDPTLGRYIQSDPIGLEGGLNRYGYVGGDPQTLTDQDGLQPRPPSPRTGRSGSVSHPLVEAMRARGQWKPAPGSPASRATVIAPPGSPTARQGLRDAQAEAARICLPQRNNPFMDRTAQQIHDMLLQRGFEPKGTNAMAGEGSYLNPRTGRSYHLDLSHPAPKGRHVGVHRPRGPARDKLPPRDYPVRRKK